MTLSTTFTESSTYTITHARHVGAKVATDLRRIQRLYDGRPTDTQIANYEAEIIALMKAGYVDHVTYGFKRNGSFIEPSLRYAAAEILGSAAIDDDPGKIRPGANIAGATFTSFLSYTSAWWALSDTQRAKAKAELPIQRSTGTEPGITGYLHQDRTYSAGGRSLQRATIRNF
ncbi:hypothetical protein [Brevundimonas sp.]|uniref:HORMA-1 domain-containing protein n=1 Tax=Brevundimonas sp. TaxID=1871086 RepID=UPI003B00234C